MRHLVYCSFLVISFIIGYVIGSYRNRANNPIMEMLSDTTFIRDTIRDTIPQPLVVYKIRTDTIKDLVVLRDTISDSLSVIIPIEVKEYLDTNYHAYISGYKANLDSIWIMSEKQVITNEIVKLKTNKWGLGIQVGAGYTDNKIRPYIGIGINYSIFSW